MKSGGGKKVKDVTVGLRVKVKGFFPSSFIVYDSNEGSAEMSLCHELFTSWGLKRGMSRNITDCRQFQVQLNKLDAGIYIYLVSICILKFIVG